MAYIDEAETNYTKAFLLNKMKATLFQNRSALTN